MMIELKEAHKKWRSEEEEKNEDLEEPTDEDIKTSLSESATSMLRKISWFLGNISFNYINIKKDEAAEQQQKDENDEQKMVRVLLESKVLSGGVENRYISSFQSETKEKLDPLFNILREFLGSDKL